MWEVEIWKSCRFSISTNKVTPFRCSIAWQEQILPGTTGSKMRPSSVYAMIVFLSRGFTWATLFNSRRLRSNTRINFSSSNVISLWWHFPFKYCSLAVSLPACYVNPFSFQVYPRQSIIIAGSRCLPFEAPHQLILPRRLSLCQSTWEARIRSHTSSNVSFSSSSSPRSASESTASGAMPSA